MVDYRKIERQRTEQARKEGKKFGLDEGMYRVAKEGGDYDWYQLEVTFYPKVKWWIEQIRGIMDPTPISGTRRELTADDPFKEKLETWL